MLKLGRQLDLALEPLRPDGRGQVRMQNLERDRS
jgi:hypothetical protein